eukprot:1172321-Prymnesium_polylepis.1
MSRVLKYLPGLSMRAPGTQGARSPVDSSGVDGTARALSLSRACTRYPPGDSRSQKVQRESEYR